jgi:hypothetical protein
MLFCHSAAGSAPPGAGGGDGQHDTMAGYGAGRLHRGTRHAVQRVLKPIRGGHDPSGARRVSYAQRRSHWAPWSLGSWRIRSCIWAVVPYHRTKGSLLLKTIGEVCRQQTQALRQELILHVHERLQLG